MAHTTEMEPWPAGATCPAEGYPDFAKALSLASYHYTYDSGEMRRAGDGLMEHAAQIAIDASWPYWAMRWMYEEIAPLPSFDSFMRVYSKQLMAGIADLAQLRADRDALLEKMQFLVDAARATTGFASPLAIEVADNLISRIRGEVE